MAKLRRRKYGGVKKYVLVSALLVVVVASAIFTAARLRRGGEASVTQPPAAKPSVNPRFWVLVPRNAGYNVVMNLTKMHIEGYILSDIEKTVYSVLTTPHFLVLGSDNHTLYSAFLLDLRSLEILRLYLRAMNIGIQAVATNTTRASIDDLAASLSSSSFKSGWIVVRPSGMSPSVLAGKARARGLKCMVRGDNILVAPSDLPGLEDLAVSEGSSIIGVYDQYPSLIYQPA